MKMNLEKTIPICWKEWDEVDDYCIKFFNAEFTENFGPFSKNQKFDVVIVDFIEGIIQSYNVGAHAEEKIECKLRFSVVEKQFNE